jgi:hypothetical protein
MEVIGVAVLGDPEVPSGCTRNREELRAPYELGNSADKVLRRVGSGEGWSEVRVEAHICRLVPATNVNLLADVRPKVSVTL